MPRVIEYLGTELELSDYQEEHRYINQKNLVDGIPVNPALRPDFDITPNDEREQLEVSDWWGKPYIVTTSWEDMSETWDEYLARANSEYGFDPGPKEDFERRMIEGRESWFKSWPTGTRYEVRCLDGGAWDRSTCWGMFGSLEEALKIAKNGSQPFG